MIRVTNDAIINIRDQVFAGKAALDENERKNLLHSIEKEIAKIIKDNRFVNFPEQISVWQEIFISLFSGQLADDFAGSVRCETFYNFGRYLLDFSGTGEAIFENKRLIHAYLDIFRLSEFLIRIYGENRWADLIHALIDKSNFAIAELFRQRVRDYENKTLFKVIRGGSETGYSWRQVDILVESYSKALLNSQSQYPGKVAFLMENSLQTALLDLACLTTGIVNIMIPANSVPQHVAFILNQTEASLLIISNEKQLHKVKSVRKEIPHLKQVVLLQGGSVEDWVMPHKEFISSAVHVSHEKIEESRSQISMDSLASIMYTSGTTGEPKGIMFSQMNIVYKRFCRAMALPEIGDQDQYLCYLPLYHTFGRWLEMMGSIFRGACYSFMENPSVETMISNMRQVKPTIFISIPKKWLQLYDRVAEKVDIEVDDESLILKAVQDITGNHLKWGLSAAGYLPAEVFQFFQKFGIEVMSGFGMTEAAGGITMTPPGQYRANSLGKALPGIEIKLGGDGELLIRGHYVMMGYYRQNNEETFMEDHWFPTGDVMRMDEDGFITIIDRKKEIYKNVKGETIAPQKIENYFRDFEYVKQVFLVGDHRPFNTVLIYANHEVENSILDEMSARQKHEYFSTVIVTVNRFLAPFERIVDFRLIDRPFSGQAGDLTPKGTYKRRVIEKNFSRTIEEMYTKNYTSISVAGMEVRIPNWFLREKGCLSGDVVALPNALSIPKLQAKLRIEKDKQKEKRYRIGDFCYRIDANHIDLQILLTNPLYWLGNLDFLHFTGKGIFLWYRQDSPDKYIRLCQNTAQRLIDPEIQEKMKLFISAREHSLAGLNQAVVLLQSNIAADKFLAVQYFRLLLEDETLPIFKLTGKLIIQPALTNDLIVRRELFKTAIKLKKGYDLKKLLESFLDRNHDLLDEQVIYTVVNLERGSGVIQAIEAVLAQKISGVEKNRSDILEHSAIPSLFDTLSSYGIHHPTSTKRIRQIIVKYQLRKDFPELAEIARQARAHLRHGFRSWLGENQTVAVDIETGEEYKWSGVIITEQDMAPKDRARIVQAISQTSILREAIFLFSEGTLIRLNNILPGGIWVSLLDSYHDKSVYRITVQTRFQGSFDIVFNLNKQRSTEDVEEEINWLILAGARFYHNELVEDFGGYRPEFDLWSAKFIPGDTVAKFLHREGKRNDEGTRKKLYYLWPFFVWNAASSYYNFWRLTGYRLQLANPAPDNFIIPTHDYQTRTRVVSFSDRVESGSLMNLFNHFYEKFIRPVHARYPFLTRKSIWNYVFSGVIDAKGEKRGVAVLNQFRAELQKSTQAENREQILRSLDTFLANVKENGFIPKQLFFAIKRYHRWFKLNNNASTSAQAQTLYEIYESYYLHELEKSYPETRTRFFLRTAFENSTAKLKNNLRTMVKFQREKMVDKADLLTFTTNIQSEYDLTENEAFFLTRLTYPHLKPTDSAALVKVKSEGSQIANLVVQLEDYDGNPYSIRGPVSPKEISRLHQLFIDTNLLVHFHVDHQFLVALSERGYIIGGLFYVYTEGDSVHMEKIVVSDRYRRKGISEGLMNEFFNRMKSENRKFVTTGFFRPEYFYRFDFKIERKYSGLVKEL